MLDINLIRENPELVRKSLRDRQENPSVVDAALELDSQRRTLLSEAETLKAERNAVSKEIGGLKDASARGAKIEAMRIVGDKISALDKSIEAVESDLNRILSMLPNLPDARTPYGKDEGENVVLKTVGTPRTFDFTSKPHWDLGPALGIIDFERGTKLTGSRFYVLSGAGARLQRALIAWSMGWEPAEAASGSHWMGPYLGHLLEDPYDVVRFVAYRSLRRLPEFSGTDANGRGPGDFVYSFLSPPEERAAARRRAFEIWSRMRGSGKWPAAEAVLTAPNGALRTEVFDRLVRKRDDRRIHLNE